MNDVPDVWVLHGARVGDNAQTVFLAEELGLPFAVKKLRYNPLHLAPSWLRGCGLGTLSEASRRLITPPWPRLVIAVGRRSVPVARHIRAASGGKTLLVHLGRPRAPLHHFDLVITTPQYGLPAGANVMELPLPFARHAPAEEAQISRWAQAWSHLPRPLVAVLVGANNFPQRFGRREARDLAAQLTKASPAGSLLLIASPRTQAPVLQELARQLGDRAIPYPYVKGAKERNPYGAALELADRLVVTSDSMSMLADGILSGRPVSVYQLPESPCALHWSAAQGLMAALARRGILVPPRNMAAIGRRLIAMGNADALGAETPGSRVLKPDYAGVVRRIHELLG